MSFMKAVLAEHDGDPVRAQAHIDREALRYAIIRQIFCERSGVVLDIRTAVLATATKDGQSRSVILAGPAFDEVRDELERRAEAIGAEMTVIDGRNYTAKGELRKKVSLVKQPPTAPAVDPQRLED